MEIIEEQITFSTTADFELGFEHQARETNYFLARPNTDIKGLVVYIPGFGEDLGGYRQVFCRKIAQNHSLAAITVDYHSIFSRPNSGATIAYDKQDIVQIEKLFLQYGLSMQGIRTVESAIETLNLHLAKANQTTSISATLKPAKGEYQNGGILSALDIINAVGNVLKRLDIPSDNIILVGSSYGGYIANLASKLAPNSFRAIFDNSSWAHPNLAYVVGREVSQPEFIAQMHSHIRTNCNLRTAWTLIENMPNTFDASRVAIRDFSAEQIAQLSKYNPNAFYYFIHAPNDTIANTDEKISMAREMIQHQMNVHMEVIEPNDVDGRYIKTINHGMGLSMLMFFDNGYQHIAEHTVSAKTDFSSQKVINYQTPMFEYEFDYKSLPVSARVRPVIS